MSYPPGVTQRMIDEAAGGYDEPPEPCAICGDPDCTDPHDEDAPTMETVTVELSPRQLEILVQALSMFIETLDTSLREGTYSAINTERRRIAHEVRSLLLAADEGDRR